MLDLDNPKVQSFLRRRATRLPRQHSGAGRPNEHIFGVITSVAAKAQNPGLTIDRAIEGFSVLLHRKTIINIIARRNLDVKELNDKAIRNNADKLTKHFSEARDLNLKYTCWEYIGNETAKVKKGNPKLPVGVCAATARRMCLEFALGLGLTKSEFNKVVKMMITAIKAIPAKPSKKGDSSITALVATPVEGAPQEKKKKFTSLSSADDAIDAKPPMKIKLKLEKKNGAGAASSAAAAGSGGGGAMSTRSRTVTARATAVAATTAIGTTATPVVAPVAVQIPNMTSFTGLECYADGTTVDLASIADVAPSTEVADFVAGF